MQNLRQYFIWTIVISLTTALFVLGKIAGAFPLDVISFGVAVVFIFVLAIFYPRQTFWLFIASLPLENIIISPDIISVSLRPFQLIGGVLLLVLLKEGFFKRKQNNIDRDKKINFPILKINCFLCQIFQFKFCQIKKPGVYLNPLDRVVAILGLAGLVGVQFSPVKIVSLKLTIILLSFIGLYWVTRNFVRNKRQIGETVWFFIVSFVAVVFFSFYQIIASKFGWNSFQVMAERINGTFTEPDWLGMYLVFLLAILLGMKYILKLLTKNKNIFGEKMRRFTELHIMHWSAFKIFRLLIDWEIILAILIIVLTVSRSAWLAGLVVLISYIFIIFVKHGWQESLKVVFFVGLKIVLVVVAISMTGLSTFHLGNRATSSVSGLQKITVSCFPNTSLTKGSKINNTIELAQFNCRHINLEEISSEKEMGKRVLEIYRPDPNIKIRKNIYKITGQEIKKHWLFGQGFGSSSAFLGRDSLGHGLNASNIFLEVLVSIGLVGFLPFLLIVLTPFVVGWRSLQINAGKYGDKQREVLAVFFLLTFLAILIPNLFNSGFFLGFFWIWLAVIVSALVIANNK
jgi:hypothetical protein